MSAFVKTFLCLSIFWVTLATGHVLSQHNQTYIHAYIKCRPRYFADDYKIRISMSDKAVADSLRKILYDTLDAFYSFVQVLDIMSTFGYEVVYQEKFKTLFEAYITWQTLGLIDTYSGRIYLFRKPREEVERRN